MPPRKLRKKHFTVYLSELHLAGLRSVKKRTGLKMSAIIRRGIREMLERHGASGFVEEGEYDVAIKRRQNEGD